MRVVYFQRKPNSHQYSIERIFDGIRKELLKTISLERRELPFFSTGLKLRIKNVISSMRHQGDVNHITGDVHYLALGLKKERTILTIHDLNFLNTRNPFKRFVLKLFWLTLPLRNVSVLTVISEATKADLLSHVDFPESKIRVIPNYYAPEYYASPKEFNASKPVILQIGTKENKNVIRLIEALDGLSCHLVIVGEHNEVIKSKLGQYLISFSWLQNLSDKDVQEQYKRCDILSFPSTIEGFGMPILEAQATGRVVLTSNISSMPEVAGRGACYVDPFDVSSIRAGVLKIIGDIDFRNELIRNGFENIKRFELANVANQYLQVYREVFEKNNY